MTEQQVVELMKSSANEEGWNANCDKVKAAHNNDYPEYWFSAIMQSGIAHEVLGG